MRAELLNFAEWLASVFEQKQGNEEIEKQQSEKRKITQDDGADYLIIKSRKKAEEVCKNCNKMKACAYSNESNMFDDLTTNEKFVWGKKIERDVVDEDFSKEEQRRKQRERMQDIEIAKRWKKEREIERAKAKKIHPVKKVTRYWSPDDAESCNDYEIEKQQNKKRKITQDDGADYLIIKSLKKAEEVCKNCNKMKACAYANESNLFDDLTINEKFVWGMKIECDVVEEGFSSTGPLNSKNSKNSHLSVKIIYWSPDDEESCNEYEIEKQQSKKRKITQDDGADFLIIKSRKKDEEVCKNCNKMKACAYTNESNLFDDLTTNENFF
ncbi:hypothetical protein POM88_044292 [Heracleum sosnowskyi]|uniref:Uncharacterized protein n=1 Tax=Heracleum sosnowskyi TaxID=360622 RepID=A0AAD8H4X0_9APIA|nr:hypothetical protein POM88_044292 [Heracleum sosnowskyi]